MVIMGSNHFTKQFMEVLLFVSLCFYEHLVLMKWTNCRPIVFIGHKKAIEKLIEKGANVNAVESEQHRTPLHYIAYFDFPSSPPKNWTADDSLSWSQCQFNFKPRP